MLDRDYFNLTDKEFFARYGVAKEDIKFLSIPKKRKNKAVKEEQLELFPQPKKPVQLELPLWNNDQGR